MKALKINNNGVDYYFLDLSLKNCEVGHIANQNICTASTKKDFNWKWYNRLRDEIKKEVVFNPKFEEVEISWYKVASISWPPYTREFLSNNHSCLKRIVKKDDSPKIVNLKKWVHINGDEASLQWGNWMSSRYYPLKKLPEFIRKFMKNNPDKVLN